MYVCVCLYFDLYSSLITLLCLLLGPLTWLSNSLMSPSSFLKYLTESNCVVHMHIAVAPFTDLGSSPAVSCPKYNDCLDCHQLPISLQLALWASGASPLFMLEFWLV